MKAKYIYLVGFVLILITVQSCKFQTIFKESYYDNLNENRVSEIKVESKFNHNSNEFDIITGVVKDREKCGLIGAEVLVSKDLKFYADYDGKFQIKIPKNESQTSIKFIYGGFRTIEVDFEKVKNKNLKVIMEPEITLLE